MIFSYVNTKKIKWGDNLPKGVAMDWRKWCFNSKYMESEFGKSLKPLYYDKIKVLLKSIQIEDAPIANVTTSNKILAYYKNTIIKVEKISPSDYGLTKIGHTGYFSRKSKDTLWKNLITELA